MPSPHLGRFESHCQALLGRGQPTIRILQLSGSLPHQFFKAARGLFSFRQVLGGFVLAQAGAQCRLHRTDQRHGLKRPLLQRHVPQIGDQLQRMSPAPLVVMMGRQDDEREVGPRRLLLDPVEQTGKIDA